MCHRNGAILAIASVKGKETSLQFLSLCIEDKVLALPLLNIPNECDEVRTFPSVCEH